MSLHSDECVLTTDHALDESLGTSGVFIHSEAAGKLMMEKPFALTYQIPMTEKLLGSQQ